MNRRLVAASTMFAAVTCCTAQLAAAQETNPEVHEFNAPLDVVLENPCSGELVAIDGNADILLQVTQTASGGLITKVHTGIIGKGIAVMDPAEIPSPDAEVRYTFGDEFDSESQTMGDQVILTNTRSIHLTSAGRTDNFALKFLQHIVINNAEPSPPAFRLTCECRGSFAPEPPQEVECVLPPTPSAQ